MPEYLSPGVYVEEIEIGAKPIEGVSTSTAAFIGGAKSGPILEPTLVTSWSQFESSFGGFISNPRIYLGYAVDAFFRNGGKRAYIVRVASSTAATAGYTIQNKDSKNAIIVKAAEVGSEGNSIKISTAETSISGAVKVFKTQVAVTSISGRDVTVADAAGFEAGDTITIADETKNENATIRSIAGKIITLEGDLANTYAAPITLRTADMKTGDKQIRLTDTSKFFIGSIVHVSRDASHSYATVGEIRGKKLLLSKGLKSDFMMAPADSDVNVESMEFTITFSRGSNSESFSQLAMDPRHPRFYRRVITSKMISVTPVDPPATATSDEKLLPADLTNQPLAGGVDDDLSALDYPSGIAPLEKVEGINLLAVPGQTDKVIQQAMLDHCERMRYRFAILDPDYNAEVAGSGSVKEQRDKLGSKGGYAALYYPWLQVSDPVSKELIFIPPSGAVAGIYARSDGERGVHKAPANETVAGTVDLERKVTKGEQEILNPSGVNVIRFFPGRGILVWGARTVASDPLWKYVNVRRLFLFLEESIDRGTQWVVFEPNDIPLWARVKQTITQFLTGVWRSGALAGATPEEAFFVKCDRTTMTQDDIDNGRLICIIGVAPVKPAEFVIFRIAQWTAGAKT